MTAASGSSDAQSFGFSDEFLATQQLPWRDGLFAGQRVLVSGGASGLGKCIATTFTRLGADLVIVGRKRERLNAAAEFFSRFGTRVIVKPLTIRNPDEVQETFAALQSEIGGIDILVNNAGGQFPQAAIDFSVKGWNAVIDTNLNGTWYMMQNAARQWAAEKRQGCIINIVVDFWRGMPGIAHTCAARAGVVYLSKTVAVEWAPLKSASIASRPAVMKPAASPSTHLKAPRRSRNPTRCAVSATLRTWLMPAPTWRHPPASSLPARCSPSMAASSSGAICGRPGAPIISSYDGFFSSTYDVSPIALRKSGVRR